MKRILSLLVAGTVMLSSGLTSFAAPKTVNITIGNDGVVVDDDTTATADNYEENYAYDGQDYVYAKVTFQGKSYAVNRSEYGTLLRKANTYGTVQENFIGYNTTQVTEQKKLEKPDPPDWDRRTPWDSWTDDDWLAYYAFAESFTPNSWQKKLLEYWSDVEIYAYYIGEYTIDENAYKEYLDAVDAYNNQKNSTTTVEKNTPVAYEEMRIYKDLFSIYNNESVYCITSDCYSDMQSYLSKLKEFSESTTDITNPNAFVQNKYYFEIGDMNEKITEYSNVEQKKAKKAVKFISENNISSVDKLSAEEQSSLYKVRVCTKTNKKMYDKTFYLTKEKAMSLLSDYLGSNTKTKVTGGNEVALEKDEIIPKG